MTTRSTFAMLVPAFLSSDGDRTTGLDGVLDSHGAAQGSYQVTSVRPVGARPEKGTEPTDREQGTRPVTHLGSDPAPSQDPLIVRVTREAPAQFLGYPLEDFDDAGEHALGTVAPRQVTEEVEPAGTVDEGVDRGSAPVNEDQVALEVAH